MNKYIKLGVMMLLASLSTKAIAQNVNFNTIVEGQLPGVLCAEYVPQSTVAKLPNDQNLQALKALAITARTHLLVTQNLNSMAYSNPNDSRNCPLANLMRQAVSETKGLTLKDSDGNQYAPYFHADCGGTGTDTPSTVYGTQVPFYSTNGGTCTHTTKMKKNYISMECFKYRAKVSQWLDITEITPNKTQVVGGRTTSFTIKTTAGDTRTVNCNDFRLPTKLTANTSEGHCNTQDYSYFKTTPVYDGLVSCNIIDLKINEQENRVEFTTKGYGHGIGFCTYGSVEKAKQGQDYKQILSSYFPGATVSY